jgi:DNA-binding NtrC family response regulator
MARVLVVDDERDVHYSFRRLFARKGIEVLSATSGEEALERTDRDKIDLVIMDIRMGGMSGLESLKRLKARHPKIPVIIMTAFGTTQTAIESMKFGAYDYILKPFDMSKLQEMIEGALALSRTMRQVVHFPLSGHPPDSGEGIVGNSGPMQEVYKQIGQVAPSDVTVLLTGERGTGKELVARAIYHHSRRAHKPYLPVNCAAIPLELLESELFGHEQGAFTGALHRKIGKFEQCNQGTLFLDEIGDMPLLTQAKLLRVLQNQTFERLGGSEPIHADVRLIVATNRELSRLMAEGLLRPDLYDRLNVVHINLPALRERPEDIPLLVDYFLHRFGMELGRNVRGISREGLKQLVAYPWPGNVRELENHLKRAMVLARSDTLTAKDILPGSQEIADQQEAEGIEARLRDHFRSIFHLLRAARVETDLLSALERQLIAEALRETRGNQTHAARLLGMNRNTLRNKMRVYGLAAQVDWVAGRGQEDASDTPDRF